jgi:transcription elongation factor Elf1
MPMPPLFAPDLNSDSLNHCPLCGSDQFDLQTNHGNESFVSQTCAVCGLSCRVVVGPESLPAEARVSDWAAVFAHD